MHRITIEVSTSVLARVLAVLEDLPEAQVTIETVRATEPEPEPAPVERRQRSRAPITRFNHPSGQTVSDFIERMLADGPAPRAIVTTRVVAEGWHEHSAGAALSHLRQVGRVCETTGNRDPRLQVWELAA